MSSSDSTPCYITAIYATRAASHTSRPVMEGSQHIASSEGNGSAPHGCDAARPLYAGAAALNASLSAGGMLLA